MGSYGVVEMRRQTIAILLLMAVCITIVLATSAFPASAAGYEWSRTFGGHFQENCYSMVNTSDGGFLIGGWTDWHLQNSSYSWSIDNFFLLKTDKYGNQEWYHTYGDNQSFLGGYVCESPGGGYILAGSLGKHSTGFVGLIKVDASGQTLQKKNYLPGFDGRVKSLEAAPDGYILAGTNNRTFSSRGWDPRKLNLDRWYYEPDLDVGRALSTREAVSSLQAGRLSTKLVRCF